MNVRLQCIASDGGAVERVSGIDGENRFQTHILAPVEVLVQAWYYISRFINRLG